MPTKEYYQKNKEKLAISMKEYREKNKGKIEAYRQTPAFKKSQKIGSWKTQGIHIEDMEILFKWFEESTNCEKCGVEFVDGKNRLTKCVDHDHNVEFNNFRAILCFNCNVNQKDTNSSGTPNIYLDKRNGNYYYRRIIDKISHCKYFKTKQEAIVYKKEFEATHIYSH